MTERTTKQHMLLIVSCFTELASRDGVSITQTARGDGSA